MDDSQEINYLIVNLGYNKFLLEQIKGKPLREVPVVDGYIIWALLEEIIEKERILT